MRTAAIITAASLALSSCGPKLCKGVLIEKQYEPSRTYSSFVMIGKVPMTRIRVDDEDFIFLLRGLDGNDTVSERHRVTAQMWNDAAVGDWVTLRDCK